MPARVHMAMENISLVSFCGSYVLDERLRAERELWTDSVVLHEMAHTFFGDAVVVRDFAHAWLKESWATVMEWEYAEDTWDQGAFHFTLFQDTAWYLAEAASRYVRPIACHEYQNAFQLFDAHLYPGGAWRLRLLRHLLGNERFWEGVSAYLHAHQRGVVETIDLRRAFETAGGADLTRFFDQWILKPGCLAVKVTHAFDTASGTLNITAMQTQTTGLFDVDLPCSVELADGSWQTVRLPLTSARSVVGVTVTCAKAPLQIVVDEHGWVPHALVFEPGVPMLLRTARHGPTALARMRALTLLAASGASTTVISGLTETLAEEASVHVRVIAARSLAKVASVHAVRAMAAACETQTHPLVLSALVSGLGASRAPAIAQPALATLFARLQDTSYSYQLMGNVLTALGTVQSHDHLPVLARFAITESHWLWTRRGAIAGLGALRSRQARDALLDMLRKGDASHVVRASVARALGTASEWLPVSERGEIIAALEAVCHLDETVDGRFAAAEALVALCGPGALSAIQAVQAITTPRDQPAIDELASQAQGSAAPANTLAQLRATIDALTARVDELQAATGGGVSKVASG
jgi:aminopeptidase N